MWIRQCTHHVKKYIRKIASSGLKKQRQRLLMVLKDNPYQTPRSL